ncbi:MAG: hypothetical protein HYV76_01795 [Candidatus Vogelbacteria bacterium]|nr:hypothetical protein [Candidatus Vogelbacteria bacterium]
MELLSAGQIQSQWRTLLIAIVSLIIGFGLGWTASDQYATPDALVSQIKKNLATTTTSTTLSGISFTVDDQPPGNQVLIRDVRVVNPVWLAVYEDREGEPGNVLGAVLVRSGNYLALAIPLLRNTIDDLPYYVQAHIDNGDNMFDRRVDLLVKDLSLTAGTFTTQTTGSRSDN